MHRVLLSPSWLLRHALALFMIGLFARLGWWQWEKGHSSHGTLQNLFYGLEWPIFAAAVIFGWWQMVREELRPTQPKEPTAARYASTVGPSDGRDAPAAPRDAQEAGVVDESEDDEELASYNRYLASLYERDASTRTEAQ